MKGNSRIVRRKKIETMNDSLTPCYLHNKTTPYCVIEIFSREVKMIEHNTIQLSGRYIVRNDLDKINIVSYINVQYGKNINFLKSPIKGWIK